uniref:Uncharacterized protein n=1 Tax=virus sp. ctd0M1 TaxID=2827993 RepID=A0A8S5REG9_9VIRU|nr:MAG TPA: hypothetical protein [virus sp. ctd0M1]
MHIFSNLKYFIKRNKPVIMRQETFDKYIIAAMNRALDIADKNRWSAIVPVLTDLERLRKNTWDQDKITDIKKWLDRNFNYNNRIKEANDDY